MTECLYDQGTVVVACAGNNNTFLPSFPGAYDWVVAVAATEEDRSLTYFSNYGNWIHLAAPGETVLTTGVGLEDDQFVSTYTYSDGTSYSTPLVCGAAALLRAHRPNWSPGQIMQRLYSTADPIEAGGDPPDRTIDGGVLNVYNALNIPVIEVVPEDEYIGP